MTARIDGIVARMSAATSGKEGDTGPGFRCAHPGYVLLAGDTFETLPFIQKVLRTVQPPARRLT
jgi:hypothetical protein